MPDPQTPEVVRLASKIMRMSDDELIAYRRDFGDVEFMKAVRQLASYVQAQATKMGLTVKTD